MGRIEFVLQEFLRSFKNNLIKDISLMVMITVGVIMTVIMSSYYLDLNEWNTENITQNIEDGTWYNAGLSEESAFYENFSSVNGCRDILEYFNDVAFYDNHPMCFAFTQQSMFAVWDELEPLFEKSEYRRFLTKEHLSSFPSSLQGKEVFLVDLKCVNLDYNAYRMFGLQTVEGEGITEKNTLLNTLKDDIPVVLGNEYKGILKVGDRFRLSLVDYVYPCKVAGILEKGAMCPEDGNTKAGKVDLDTYIIFPYGIRFKSYEGIVSDIDKYAFWDVMTLTNGANVLIKDRKDMSGLMDGYLTIADKYNLPPISVYGTSLGINLLKNESKESIRIMLLLTIALICFTIYSLLIMIYEKIQANSKVYGIYLMNGSSVLMIAMSYVLEIIIVIFPSVITSRYIFGKNKFGAVIENSFSFMGVIYCSISLILLIAVVFVFHMVRSIDTEYLIKQED